MTDELRDTIRRYYERVIARLQRRIEAETDIVGQYRLRRAARNRKKSLRELLTQGDQQVTIKPSATSNDGGPGSGNHGHKGVPGEVGGSAPTASAKGENVACQGFEHKKTAAWKIRKHKSAYSGMSIEEYEEHAISLLKKPCGDDFDGYLANDGSVCRFNTTTGEFAKGYPGGYIKTCFNPGYNEKNGKFSLERANRYFQNHKAEEEVLEKKPEKETEKSETENPEREDPEDE